MWVWSVSGSAALGLVACSGGVDPGNNLTFGSPATTANQSSTTSETTGFDTTNDEDDDDDDSGEADSADASTSGKPEGESGETFGGDAVCGDGIASGGEGCDGEDLGGSTCMDFGFDEGALVCDAQCNLITEGCNTCGDGMATLTEACDGADFGGETCMTQGFGGGVLACSPSCTMIDTSGCTPLASCGDGARNGAEQCDGNDLGGSNCSTLGFDFGMLACAPGSCTYNTQGCSYLTCGQQGDFCIYSESNPQSICCDAGVGDNIVGLCVGFVCA